MTVVEWRPSSGATHRVTVSAYPSTHEIGMDVQTEDQHPEQRQHVFTNLTPEPADRLVHALLNGLDAMPPKPLTPDEKVVEVRRILDMGAKDAAWRVRESRKVLDQ